MGEDLWDQLLLLWSEWSAAMYSCLVDYRGSFRFIDRFDVSVTLSREDPRRIRVEASGGGRKARWSRVGEADVFKMRDAFVYEATRFFDRWCSLYVGPPSEALDEDLRRVAAIRDKRL